MPRKDLTQERTEQILEAFESCVIKYGLEGSTLEKISEEAGVKRAILRHYIGNREDLINALCEKVLARYREQIALLKLIPSDDTSGKTLLNHLFVSDSQDSIDEVLLAENLIAAAQRYPAAQRAMQSYVDELTDQLAECLQPIAPSATDRQRWNGAYGILCILFNHASLAPLGLDPEYGASARFNAEHIVKSLKAGTGVRE